MFRIISFVLVMGWAGAVLAQEPDPAEARLVAEFSAQATQNQHVIEAVKAFVTEKAKEKNELIELQKWVKEYFASQSMK